MPQVSVILPVFNSSQFISKCIESVLAQSFSDFELIIVDDGSTDNTFELCASYSEKDSRIKLIRQENLGVSSARNNALSVCSGKYVTFIDSDDTYYNDTLKTLYENITITKSQISICDAIAVTDSDIKELETIVNLPESCVLDRKHIKPDVLLEIAGAVWRCIYDISIIRKHSILFPKELKIAEDRIFNLYAIGYANRISYIKRPLYHRYLHGSSTVHRYHSDYFTIVKQGRAATKDVLMSVWDNEPTYQVAYLNQFVFASIVAVENIKHKDSPHNFRKRWHEISLICNDEELHNAIAITKYSENDFRARWIYNKSIPLLMMKSMKPYWQYRRLKRLFSLYGLKTVFKRIRIN